MMWANIKTTKAMIWMTILDISPGMSSDGPSVLSCQSDGTWSAGGSCSASCSRKCLHGGVCVSNDHCSCVPGYYGAHCQHGESGSIYRAATSHSQCVIWYPRHDGNAAIRSSNFTSRYCESLIIYMHRGRYVQINMRIRISVMSVYYIDNQWWQW